MQENKKEDNLRAPKQKKNASNMARNTKYEA
jgi:hypothetical protein